MFDMLGMFNNILNENFNYRKFDEGQISFTNSSLSDPHIQEILDFVSKESGIAVNILEAKAQHGLDGLKERAAIAPKLYTTIYQNGAESEAFNMLCAVDARPKGSPKFLIPVFNELREEIIADHMEGVWPLRGNIERRPLYTPGHYTPDNEIDFSDELVKKVMRDKIKVVGDEGKKGDKPNPHDIAHRIGTAAATPSGDFYFNVKFMQKLIDFAWFKKVKPNGLKYVCNGGKIPDEYCYIEFLIMHEYLHYMEEDFYYQHIIPGANPTLINWVGDFRSNYLLVKSGYEQLPMGLFSDHINFDRQPTYSEMYNEVKGEFAKFPPPPSGGGGGAKRPIQVGDKVKMPNGKPGIVEEIFKGKAKVRPE